MIYKVLILTSIALLHIATATMPACTVNFCATNGAMTPCLIRTLSTCAAYSKTPDAKKMCDFQCLQICETGSMPIGSDGRKYCSVCHLHRTSCDSGFKIFGPVNIVPAGKAIRSSIIDHSPAPQIQRFTADSPIPNAERLPTDSRYASVERLPADSYYPATERLPANSHDPVVERLPANSHYPVAERLPANSHYPVTERLPANSHDPVVERHPANSHYPASQLFSDISSKDIIQRVPTASLAPQAQRLTHFPASKARRVPAHAPVPAAHKAATAPALVPTICSVDFCTANGAKAFCLLLPLNGRPSTNITCRTWARLPDAAQQCSFLCTQECLPEEKQPLASDGTKYCTVCRLHQASCASGFELFGPVEAAAVVTPIVTPAQRQTVAPPPARGKSVL